MVDGADARAEGEARRDGAGDVVLRGAHRGRDVVAEGEVGGDGRGEGAAGAVGVAVVEAGGAEPVLLGAVGEEVHGLALQVAALDQGPARAEGEDGPGRLGQVLGARDVDAGELGDLVQIGGRDGGDGEQSRTYGVERVGGEQRVTVLGDAHRVDDGRCVGRREELRDRLDERGRGEHPGLDRMDADVVDDAAVLGAHGLDGEVPGALHTERVLRRDGGEHAHPVHAQREHRLEVRLDAGATAGVGTGHGQDARGYVHTPESTAPSAPRRSHVAHRPPRHPTRHDAAPTHHDAPRTCTNATRPHAPCTWAPCPRTPRTAATCADATSLRATFTDATSPAPRSPPQPHPRPGVSIPSSPSSPPKWSQPPARVQGAPSTVTSGRAEG
ncbi:putative phosphomethylpyrimidine kinase [Streptomyces sp. Tu6071]|nr:putative phosphomethylpyrimidine kinase [Streptomyces sp. Tu6071]